MVAGWKQQIAQTSKSAVSSQKTGERTAWQGTNLASNCCAAARHCQKDCCPNPCQPRLSREPQGCNKVLQPPAGVIPEKTDQDQKFLPSWAVLNLPTAILLLLWLTVVNCGQRPCGEPSLTLPPNSKKVFLSLPTGVMLEEAQMRVRTLTTSHLLDREAVPLLPVVSVEATKGAVTDVRII